MKKFWRKIIIISMMTMIVSTAMIALAREVSFEKKFVDSNTFGAIIGAQKESQTDTAALYISNIYKDNGSPSSYQYVWVCSNSIGSNRVLAAKGSWTNVPLGSPYTGSWAALYAMGHDPALDCQISGTWNVH